MKISLHSLKLLLVASTLAIAGGCDDEGGDDDGADTGSSAPGDDGDGADDGDDGADDGGGDGGSACADACATLGGDPACAAMGIDESSCGSLCTSDACAACLGASAECGTDCQSACAGGGDDGADDGGGDSSGGADDGADDGGIPQPECINDGECGISFQCVSCGLNDGEGWCVQTMECSFDEDCGSGGKCGYNVQSGDYRCLPAEYCG